MRSFEEVGNSGGVCGKESLFESGDTVSAPVNLNEFRQLRLRACSCSVRVKEIKDVTNTVGSITRANAY